MSLRFEHISQIGHMRQTDPCPCKRGRRFKHCCGAPADTRKHVDIKQGDGLLRRNIQLLDAIADIFKLRKANASWDDVRSHLSADHVREVYQVVRALWPPGSDIVSMLPPPAEGLRAFYVGDSRPEFLPRGVVSVLAVLRRHCLGQSVHRSPSFAWGRQSARLAVRTSPGHAADDLLYGDA